MNVIRRKRDTRNPKTGFTANVTIAVPTKSHRTVSSPLRIPSASRAGRITMSAVSTQKKKTTEARSAGISLRRTLAKRWRTKVMGSRGWNGGGGRAMR